MNLLLWFLVFFIFYVLTPIIPSILGLVVPGSLIPTISSYPSVVIVLIGFGLAYVLSKQGQSSDETNAEQKLSSTFVVLSAIYGIVGGLAITTAIAAYIDTLEIVDAKIATPLDLFSLLSYNDVYFTNTILLLSFFAVALPTYLGSTYFLSREFKPQQENVVCITPQQKEGDKILFSTFILSFVQSIFLYFMSTSVTDFSRFIVWLFLLQFINSTWAIWQLIHRSKNLVYKPPPPREWIPLDVLTVLFLSVYFLYSMNLTWKDSIYLLVVVSGRALVDLRVGWESVYRHVIRQK
jgi:hypothetical protein